MIWIALAVVAVVVLAIAAWAVSRARRRAHLKEHFGPEHRHVVEERGDLAEAEAELAGREARVKEYEIHELPAPEIAQRSRRGKPPPRTCARPCSTTVPCSIPS